MGNYTSMFIYITIYTIATILIAAGIKRNSKLIIVIGILIPVLFAAFRYQVGTDYLNYLYAYEEACQSKLSLFIKWMIFFGNRIKLGKQNKCTFG